jgi:general secretion pathway protein K
MNANRTVKRGERGAALLTVLLLVAVIAVLATSAVEKLGLSTRLTGNAIALDQARSYALAGETFATAQISDFIVKSEGQPTQSAAWQGKALTTKVDGGLVTATIGDGGNCFNLNSVVNGGPDTPLTARPSGIEQFAALIRLIGGRPDEARGIALALADWIDSDSDPVAGGGEDDLYSRATPAYRTSNTLLSDPSELRAVAGVTPQIYASLHPFICTLPNPDPAQINVNTLQPAQAILVASLIPGQLDVASARQAILNRPAGGYESSDAFWKLPALAGVATPPEVLQQTQTQTRWFMLRLQVELAGAELVETALIDGGLRPARLVRRSWGDD